MRPANKAAAATLGGAGLGGLSWAMDYFNWPIPPAIGWLVFVASIGLIIFSLYEWVRVFVGWRRGNKLAAASAPNEQTILVADWPMSAACRYVRKNLSDQDELVREIEEKARSGLLRVWGRKYSTASASQNPNPPREIPMDHWDDYSLDELRCLQSDDDAECCTEPRNNWRGDYSESFQDLEVNKAQVLSIWPKREN